MTKHGNKSQNKHHPRGLGFFEKKTDFGVVGSPTKLGRVPNHWAGSPTKLGNLEYECQCKASNGMCFRLPRNTSLIQQNGTPRACDKILADGAGLLISIFT